MQVVKEEELVLYPFDKAPDYVPKRFVGVLNKYTWISLQVHSKGLLIYGRRGSIWYEKDTVLRLLEKPYSPRFESLMNQADVIKDKLSCWFWTGFAPNELPSIKTTSHKHSYSTQSVQYLLCQLIFNRRPDRVQMKCFNSMCIRPSHIQVEYLAF